MARLRALREWFDGHVWALSRVHAYTGGCFVIAASDPLSETGLATIERAFGPQPKLQTGAATSLILDPWGNVLARHTGGDERLVVAEADLSLIAEVKLQHDSCGRGARHDVFRLDVDTRAATDWWQPSGRRPART